MTNSVLLIIIAVVVVLGPLIMLGSPADPRQWGHGSQNGVEPDSDELPELLRRPPRPRPR